MPYVGKHTIATPRSGRRGFAAVALASVGAALTVLGLHGDVSSAGAPSASEAIVADGPARVPSPQSLATKSRAKTDSKRSPVSLRIPAIGVAANITRLGLSTDKTVEVPEDPDDAGWYRKGPTPGESGSAVILGHVDSKVGPAVFYRLKNLDPGDRIAVELDSGMVAQFEVARVAHYANEDFPRQKVYADKPDRPALNLVTCGGKYDPEAGGYQSNVVVYTTYLWASNGDGPSG